MSTDAERAAQQAAEKWLASIDLGDAQASWEGASSSFRSAVSAADWESSLERVQGSVGKPVRRVPVSAEYRTELPGAPDGEYVVLKYETTFEHKAHGQETVVPQLEADGEWRVSGYWVR